MFSVPVMKPLSPQPLGEREAGSVGLRGLLNRFRGLSRDLLIVQFSERWNFSSSLCWDIPRQVHMLTLQRI